MLQQTMASSYQSITDFNSQPATQLEFLSRLKDRQNNQILQHRRELKSQQMATRREKQLQEIDMTEADKREIRG